MLRRDVIREIVARDRQEKELTEEIVSEDAKQLYQAGCEHFGTWDTALRYAGISARSMAGKGKLTAETVKSKLVRLCTSKYNLEETSNLHRDRRLHDAAVDYFGSWREALRAAGINPNNIRKGWKKGKPGKRLVLEGIRRRHKLGLSLRWRDACRENNSLAMAAKNRFGSWIAAVRAAGCAPENESQK